MQYVAITVGDLLPKRRGESPTATYEADDCQPMEYAEGVLSMQRQRSHIHEDKREDVDGSDHSVSVRAFGEEENGGTRT